MIPWNFAKPKLLLATAAVLGCAYNFAPTQGVGTEKNENKAPLRFRIILPEPSVCAKTHLDLEIELQNTSTHAILIDPKGLLYQLSFDADNGGKAVTNDPGPNSKPGPFVTLAPGESYIKAMPYRLDDALFSSAGIYRVQLKYGQFSPPSAGSQDLYTGSVDSNVALFELRECRAANP